MSDDNKKPSFCTYWRRVALIAPLLGLVSFVCGVIGMAIVAVVNVVANFATILLGYGVVLCFPEKKTMQIPFNVTVHGEKRSLSKFLQPFWAVVAVVSLLWLGFSNYPNSMFHLLKVIGAIVVVILGVIGLLFGYGAAKEKLSQQSDGPVAEGWRLTKLWLKAKKEKICPLIEFVEPGSQEKPQLSEPPTA